MTVRTYSTGWEYMTAAQTQSRQFFIDSNIHAPSDFWQVLRGPTKVTEADMIHGYPVSSDVRHAYRRVMINHTVGFADEKLLRGWIVQAKIAPRDERRMTPEQLEGIVMDGLRHAKEMVRYRQQEQLEREKRKKDYARPFDPRANVTSAASIRRHAKGQRR